MTGAEPEKTPAWPSDERTVGVRPGPGAEMASAAETLDLADLGDHEHGGVGPDAAQLAEHLEACELAPFPLTPTALGCSCCLYCIDLFFLLSV